MKTLLLGAALTAMTTSLTVAGAAHAAPPPPKDYANCTALNKVYPHGVGMPGAKDKTSSEPVTNFLRAPKVYQLNDESDADKDKIACEKH